MAIVDPNTCGDFFPGFGPSPPPSILPPDLGGGGTVDAIDPPPHDPDEPQEPGYPGGPGGPGGVEIPNPLLTNVRNIPKDDPSTSFSAQGTGTTAFQPRYDDRNSYLARDTNFGVPETSLVGGATFKFTPNAPFSKTFIKTVSSQKITGDSGNFKWDEANNYFKSDPTGFFRPVSNTRFLNVLHGIIHDNFQTVLKEHDLSNTFTPSSLDDIPNQAIIWSIRPDIVEDFQKVRDSLGRPLKLSNLANSIRNLLLSNRLSDINIEHIQNLVTNSQPFDLDKNNLLKLRPNELEILSYILDNSRSIDPNNEIYSVNQKSVLETFWLRPTEIFEKVKIETVDGSNALISVSDSGEASALLFNGSAVVLEELNEDHTFNITLFDGTKKRISTDNNISNTKVLSNFDKGLVLHWLGQKNNFTLTASGPIGDDVEFTYDLSSPPGDVYVLKLDRKTSYSKVDQQESSLVASVSGEYTIVTDPSSTVFNEFIKYRSSPYQVFYISNQDPVTGYFDNSSTKVTLEYKTPSLAAFSTVKGETSLSTSIPIYLFIITSDRLDRIPFVGYSQLVVNEEDNTLINKRKLVITPSLDKRSFSPGLSTPLKFNFSQNIGNSTDIHGNNNSQAVEFSFNSSSNLLANSTNYGGTKPTTRDEFGVRTFNLVVSGLVNNFELVDKDFTHKDVFSRLDNTLYFNLFNTAKKDILDAILDKYEVSLTNVPINSSITTKIGPEITATVIPPPTGR